ncbi:MAG: helix-turn-helix transcriptional regulator [Treponema sp.]|nr:helix-turn-helix transcriptional regulator [Treponema sp.]
MESNLLTAEDVAKQLRIKKYTVYELIKRGEFPSSKVGRQMRISQSDIDLYLQANKTGVHPLPQETPNEEPLSKKNNAGPVIICGQDACLDLFLTQLGRTGEFVLRSFMGCYNGLIALYNGRITMATAHLWDSETDTYNYSFIRFLLPGLPVGVLRLAGRMEGFYVKKGNPLNIWNWKDLARPEITMINRERGCGARILLDQKLLTLGINAAKIRGYTQEISSHMVCASAVAKSDADVGIGCERGAESIAGVEFIPLQLEWYDFIFRLEDRETHAVKTIVSYATGEEFKRDLLSMGGYDISQTGAYREF